MKLTFFKDKTKSVQVLAAVLIFALAFALRVIGAGWGMPYDNLHPDEGFVYAEAYECALNRSFETRTYYRPNHVSIKLNTLLYIGIQEVYFFPQGLDDFGYNFREFFPIFMTASRVLAAVMGMGAVVFAYLIARFWDEKKALYAALLFSVFFSFIEHSHYLTPDMPLLLFLMATLWAALSYHKNPTMGRLFLMSFFTALATCEKYPGLFGCLLIATTVILTNYKKPLIIVRDGLLAIFFLLLGIFIISPVLILDIREVLHTMQGQNKESHLGADGLNFIQTVVYYSKNTVVGLGLILTVCGIYGIVKSFIKNTKPTIILFAFLIYILPISTLKIHWERYTLPIYAAMLLFGTFGAFYLYDDLLVKFKESKSVKAVLCIVLFVLPVLSQVAGGVASTARFLAPDSRVALQPVFEEMGVSDANTVHDCSTPLDPGGYYGVFMYFDELDPSKYKYGTSPKYVMTSASQRDLFIEDKTGTREALADFYRLLDDEYETVGIYTTENPEPHFLEAVNIFSSVRSVVRYIKGAMWGYEIRLYQITD